MSEGKKQIKSRERVVNHGEVFTNEREVKAMCDLVDHETNRIDSRFLEPACGDGNFLAEILQRKLEIVKSKYKKSTFDFEKNSLLAVSSLYGVDILIDNVLICRERLFKIWDKSYSSICKKDCNDETRESVKFILEKNIVCGNALTLCKVDGEGNDLKEPIVFSEWSFITGVNLQRKDYTMAELLCRTSETNNSKSPVQMSLFENNDIEPTLLKQYISNYRRIKDNG